MENKAINMEIKKGGRNERSKIGGQKERKRQRKWKCKPFFSVFYRRQCEVPHCPACVNKTQHVNQPRLGCLGTCLNADITLKCHILSILFMFLSTGATTPTRICCQNCFPAFFFVREFHALNSSNFYDLKLRRNRTEQEGMECTWCQIGFSGVLCKSVAFVFIYIFCC